MFFIRPHRLTVRTEAFQALNRSSILRGVTKERASSSTREGSPSAEFLEKVGCECSVI